VHQNSVVGTVARLYAGWSGIQIPGEARDFSFYKMFRLALDPTQPLFGVYWGSFSGVKWLGHDGNHSLLSGVEVKNEWSCTFAPPVLVLGVILPVPGLIQSDLWREYSLCAFPWAQ
jgi:hypothetical protein